MLENWQWEEYIDYANKEIGFVGTKQASKLYLFTNLKRNNAVWRQKAEFSFGNIVALDKATKKVEDSSWISTKFVLLLIPSELWPKALEIHQKCLSSAEKNFYKEKDKFSKELTSLSEPPSKLVQNLEKAFLHYQDLLERYQNLEQVVSGKLSPEYIEDEYQF